jgi:hypothetical protein
MEAVTYGGKKVSVAVKWDRLDRRSDDYVRGLGPDLPAYFDPPLVLQAPEARPSRGLFPLGPNPLALYRPCSDFSKRLGQTF